jgi:hypothetical protein
MVVSGISRFGRGLRGDPPEWAVTLLDEFTDLRRKAETAMALDFAVLNRILVGAKFLVTQRRADQQKIEDLTRQLNDANAELGRERAAETEEDAADAKGNADANTVADEVEALINGPQTPTIEEPQTPAEVVEVVTGNTDPVVVDAGPVADGSVSGVEGAPEVPSPSASEGEAPQQQ